MDAAEGGVSVIVGVSVVGTRTSGGVGVDSGIEAGREVGVGVGAGVGVGVGVGAGAGASQLVRIDKIQIIRIVNDASIFIYIMIVFPIE